MRGSEGGQISRCETFVLVSCTLLGWLSWSHSPWQQVGQRGGGWQGWQGWRPCMRLSCAERLVAPACVLVVEISRTLHASGQMLSSPPTTTTHRVQQPSSANAAGILVVGEL